MDNVKIIIDVMNKLLTGILLMNFNKRMPDAIDTTEDTKTEAYKERAIERDTAMRFLMLRKFSFMTITVRKKAAKTNIVDI